MLREAIELAGDKALMLYVHKDNEIALHVYEKAGFQLVGELGTLAWAMAYSGNEAGQEIIKHAMCCV
jgi:ribosomal protein S18 acetylase RimI-like enzyme